MSKSGIEYFYLTKKEGGEVKKKFVQVPPEKLYKVGKLYKVRTGWAEFSNGAMILNYHNITSRTFPFKVIIAGVVVDTYTTWNTKDSVIEDWKKDEALKRRKDHADHIKKYGYHKLIMN